MISLRRGRRMSGSRQMAAASALIGAMCAQSVRRLAKTAKHPELFRSSVSWTHSHWRSRKARFAADRRLAILMFTIRKSKNSWRSVKLLGDFNRKSLNLHHGINITDAFMQAVKNDEEFGLISPKTNEVIRTVNARKIWQKILELRIQTGEPYLLSPIQ